MPGKPFSGKQKKQQLQERRARKKEKRPIGADTDSDSGDSEVADNHFDYLHGGDHHRDAPEKEKKGGEDVAGGQGRGAGGRGGFAATGRGRGGGRGGHGKKKGGEGGGEGGEEGEEEDASNDVYGGDKKGVRSEFKREHRREIKERQQANYAPLTEREFINADKGGITFGQWFKVANLGARRQYTTTVDGVKMGEGGYSSTFLYSIALPKRARVTGEDGTDIFADHNDDSDDYDQGPRGGRGGRGTGRGGRGRGSAGKGVGGRGGDTNPEFTDTSTTTSSDDDDEGPRKGKGKASSSSSSSEDSDEGKGGAAAATPDADTTTTTTTSACTTTKAHLKDLKARLAAASAYDARERQVFRHWMNAIDRKFGVVHDARQEEEEEAAKAASTSAGGDKDNGGEEGEDGEEKERKKGRRNRAVDKANAPPAAAPPPPHPLAHLELNLFERNIDVWRQLWRTVENSDVVVAVADARYPLVHLPLSLLMHIIGDHGKPLVVVLNKVDLMKEAVLEKWEKCLRSFWEVALKPLLPTEKHALVDSIAICRFTCSPEAGTALAKGDEKATSRRKKKGPRNAKLYEELKAGESKKGQSAYAPSRREKRGHLFDYAAKEKEEARRRRQGREAAPADEDDFSSNSDDDAEYNKDNKDNNNSSSSDSDSDSDSSEEERAHLRQELVIVKGMIGAILDACRALGSSAKAKEGTEVDAPPSANSTNIKDSSIVHIGIVGHPNVGKSSLINCIRGSKVVSVSATAGHTKHLQTVPLLDDGVVLIDCPGLAFPVLGLPKPMQAVLGTHQIAQTRDPQSGVAYLAARLQLERIYQLRKVGSDRGPHKADEDKDPWSAYELCEAYGHKKGFHVKKGKGAVDVHRAAIALLSEAYEGRLVLAFAPPPQEYLRSPAFLNTVRKYLFLDPEWIYSSSAVEQK